MLNLSYLVPRVCGWTLLLAVALFDALKHRQVKRRGSQLQRGLIAVVFAYVVQDILLLAFAVLSDHRSPSATPVCGSYIFFTDLADTLMIVRPSLSLKLSLTSSAVVAPAIIRARLLDPISEQYLLCRLCC